MALLGLLVGLLSVTQMARSQSELIQRGFSAVQLGQQLRQHLGDELLLLIAQNPDAQRLAEVRQAFRAALAKGSEAELGERYVSGLEEAQKLHDAMESAAAQGTPAGQTPHNLGAYQPFTDAFVKLRNHLLDEQNRVVDTIIGAEQQAGDRPRINLTPADGGEARLHGSTVASIGLRAR
mgnify:CR=1 FL=1